MGILFTAEEKREAYRRITGGHAAMGSVMLTHIMKGRNRAFIPQNEEEQLFANKSNCAYRLIQRGLIVTADQFYEKSNILLGGK